MIITYKGWNEGPNGERFDERTYVKDLTGHDAANVISSTLQYVNLELISVRRSHDETEAALDAILAFRYGEHSLGELIGDKVLPLRLDYDEKRNGWVRHKVPPIGYGLCCTVNDTQCLCNPGCRCRCEGCTCGPVISRRGMDNNG